MARDSIGIEYKLFPQNIIWEPTLTDIEKILLIEIQYKSRLSKEASTESNKTMGTRLNKSPDTINSILGSLEKKGWIRRIKDFRERSQRRIELSPQSISLITKPFIEWYVERVGKFAYPPISKDELEIRIGRVKLKKYINQFSANGWIKDQE